MRILIILPVLLLAACGGEERLPITPIDFAGAPPIVLEVATVQVVDEYEPPKTRPHVEHAAPLPPYQAVRLWANERLRAAGSIGYVRVGIKDAAIVEKPMGDKVEYDGTLDVTLDASSGDDRHTATGEITVERQVTIDRRSELAQKEQIWNDMTRDMMAEFDHRAQRLIAENFTAFTPPGTP